METFEDHTVVVHMIFGSHLYGTATATSDTDYKGVFLPTVQEVLLQRVPNSIANSTKAKETDKNTSADIDKELYSLHYFLKLACAGETVALDMLHAPPSAWIEASSIWRDLVRQRAKFYTRNLKAFVGYARRQAAKYGIKGSRLAEAKRVLALLVEQPPSTRMVDIWPMLPEGEHLFKTSNEAGLLYSVCGKKLTEKAYCHHYVPMLDNFINTYGARAKEAETNKGIDWKAVSHAFRAGYQVYHILKDGDYTYPLPETNYICQVKAGVLNFQTEVQDKLEELMDTLETLSAHSSLPEKVDQAYWDEWLYYTILYMIHMEV